MNAHDWMQKGLNGDLFGNPAEAKTCFEEARKLDPKLPGLVSLWVWAKLAICDWSGLDDAFGQYIEEVEADRLVYPYANALVPLTAAQQLKAVQSFIRGKYTPRERPSPSRTTRIRVGYFGRDFYNHSTMHLMGGMFEQHDRDRFDVTIFSSSPVVDHYTLRARDSGARFLDVSKNTNEEIAAKARAANLDIAVNLRGFYDGDALGPFALGLAPVQASYLVYPGTLGSECIDYLIADPTIIPFSDQAHYSEKVVYLSCYQVNDRSRPFFDPKPPGRFTFGCFNANMKIVPSVFNTWMRLLKQIPDSELWLLRSNEAAEVNLKAEAEARGVASDRLVFHKPVEVAQHLERSRRVSLFLDTPYYNAHTTASDALWGGIPVLTQQGGTFASRVASSLLTSVGLKSLITTSLEAYEAKALELASNPSELRAMQDHLVKNRGRFLLFDTRAMTRAIEKAYALMYAKKGEPTSIWAV